MNLRTRRQAINLLCWDDLQVWLSGVDCQKILMPNAHPTSLCSLWIRISVHVRLRNICMQFFQPSVF